MTYPGKTNRSTLVTGAILLAFITVIIGSAIFSKVSVQATGSDGSVTMFDGLKTFAVSGSVAPEMAFRSNLMASDEYDYSAGETAADVDQKIIKTGELEITVDGVSEHVQQIIDTAVAAGGFVQSSSVSEDPSGNRNGWVTIRIPADKFESTVQAVKDLAVHVEYESSNGQDVTEQYTDLEARLNAAKAQEEQYLTILEDASTVGEVLAVQEHLADVRMTIESLEGQIKYLENQTSYSTLSVRLSEETNVSFPADKFDIVREVKSAAKYVVVLAQQALAAIIWIVIVGGAIIIPLSILGFIGRALFRRLKK